MQLTSGEEMKPIIFCWFSFTVLPFRLGLNVAVLLMIRLKVALWPLDVGPGDNGLIQTVSQKILKSRFTMISSKNFPY